jgi:hypothetical protein
MIELLENIKETGKNAGHRNYLVIFQVAVEDLFHQFELVRV